MSAVLSFCGLCFLLIIGKVLRMRLTFMQKLYLPSSVIGGVVGLILLSTFPSGTFSNYTSSWSSVPGFLINIVFAALFLGVKIPKIKAIWHVTFPQLCYGQILAFAQYVIGVMAVFFILKPLYHVSDGFAGLIEVGFEGGHGTVSGLSNTFKELGWAEGTDLGLTMATIGMIAGVVIGMWLINIAVRRGWTKNVRLFQDRPLHERRGIYPDNMQPAAGKQTVSSDSIDSFALHIAIIGLAVIFGCVIKEALALLNTVMPQQIQELKVLASFPLFPLCMIGGLLVQKFFTVIKVDYIIDHGTMQRLAGTALDFLVVSAIASIRLDFVLANWQPIMILAGMGILLNVLGVLFLAPKIFSDAWFERGIAEFGQSTGVTATGLLLLRTVDPDSETPAAEAFGYKQLLHEPIMGGGIWTSLAIPLLLLRGMSFVFFFSLAMIILWVIFFLIWKKCSK
ncbi:MAG: sodium:glutamate symporter [Lentisphaeria bacterium]|nr:sodium:glutamate symporter [Lentisphaeria bacterium]